MMTKTEIIERFSELNFIITQRDKLYTIRAPDFMDTEDTKEIHESIMNGNVEVITTINNMLVLLLKNGLVEIED